MTYGVGIDQWNSPGYPQWCLDPIWGTTKEPEEDDYGWQTCGNDHAFNGGHYTYYELKPDASTRVA